MANSFDPAMVGMQTEGVTMSLGSTGYVVKLFVRRRENGCRVNKSSCYFSFWRGAVQVSLAPGWKKF